MCMTIARDGGTGGVWDLKEGLLQKPTGPVQSVYSASSLKSRIPKMCE